MLLLQNDQPAFNKIKKNVSMYLHQPDTSPDANPFSMAEFKCALEQCPDQGALGRDDAVYAEKLHMLYHPMLCITLPLANRIWESGELPSSFHCSTILPFLKNGKPLEKCASYCPIALSSILGKLIERLVVTRLTYCLEQNSILSAVQSGNQCG
jgi:hypothetical protein